ncbi:hypothetical protein GCM10011509_19550 [Ornithinimicrobium pekingense]|uniref:Sulfotransferase n=2 Tax=Ornithinimicrobium pekingense TaxID=384677 RepID=A0ABQ2F8W7_9MICO|nr:hypothetical protein GCM10011509_19550 [Ornithinimicrobium pekingense]
MPARGGRGAPQHPGQIFVLGNQKAGTTAIAALLAECSDEPFVSDVLYTNKVRLRDVLADRPSLAELAEKHPESFAATVVKDNDFVFLYPQLAAQFPNARFLFVVRDPRQNVRSILNRLQIPGDLPELPQEEYDRLAKKLKGWHGIITGADFGESGGHYIDVLADRWIRAARTYLDSPEKMTLVRYEDFDADKRGFIERLARDLGLSVVNDISTSQDKQYQPRGDREVTPQDFFGANLERLERRCADLMPRFGYAPLTRLDG